MPFMDETAGRVIDETITGEFDILLGRRTYDIFAGYWPNHGDNPVGKAFNRVTKYVVTHRTDRLAWDKSQRLGDLEEVRRLKATEGPVLHLWGSSELLQTLIAGNLVDEHRLWIFPVVLGNGKRLFEQGVPPRGLALVETKSTPSGIVIAHYRPAGPVKIES